MAPPRLPSASNSVWCTFPAVGCSVGGSVAEDLGDRRCLTDLLHERGIACSDNENRMIAAAAISKCLCNNARIDIMILQFEVIFVVIYVF